jgi:tetratricopeptide (TPR) repeat protein
VKGIYAIIFILLPVNFTFAHGELDQRIKDVSAEIKTDPDSAFLYLKRGELYYQHEEYKKSIRDFKKCSKLDYKESRLLLGFAKSYERLDKFTTSLDYVNHILANNAQNVRALRLKGQIHFKMKKYSEAAQNFEMVVKYASKTIPENYLEISQAWEKSSDNNAPQKASNSVKKGILDLGELHVFYTRLVELCLKFEDYDSALVYQTKMLENSKRKEKAFYSRALTYLKLGNTIAARSDLEMSLSAINQLPERTKNYKAMKDLKTNVLQSLERL